MIGLFQEPGKKATVFVAQQKKTKNKTKNRNQGLLDALISLTIRN